MSEHMPEMTDEDVRVLEELVELQESDPARYERIVREGIEEAETQEHGAALLDAIAGADEHRQAENCALLDAITRSQAEGAE